MLLLYCLLVFVSFDSHGTQTRRAINHHVTFTFHAVLEKYFMNLHKYCFANHSLSKRNSFPKCHPQHFSVYLRGVFKKASTLSHLPSQLPITDSSFFQTFQRLHFYASKLLFTFKNFLHFQTFPSLQVPSPLESLPFL